jgi:hypothetical protein
MKKYFSTAVLGIIMLPFVSCTKEGLNGENMVVAHPKHHSVSIKGATVYVKFNAKELPGTKPTDYDANFVGKANEDHVHIEGLKKGNYFLYAVGFDSTIMQPVTGGLAIDLSKKSGETDVEIHITE